MEFCVLRRASFSLAMRLILASFTSIASTGCIRIAIIRQLVSYDYA